MNRAKLANIAAVFKYCFLAVGGSTTLACTSSTPALTPISADPTSLTFADANFPAQDVTITGTSSIKIIGGDACFTSKQTASTSSSVTLQITPSIATFDACILEVESSSSDSAVLWIPVVSGTGGLAPGTSINYTATFGYINGELSTTAIPLSSSNTAAVTVPSSVTPTIGTTNGLTYASVSFPIKAVASGNATISIYGNGSGSPATFAVPVSVGGGGSVSTPTPSPSPTASPVPATECITGSTNSLTADENLEAFVVGGLTTSSQASCTGLNASTPNQILFAGNASATTASFNVWNGAPYGIIVPSTAVTDPQVLFAMELTASPATTFTGSVNDPLFLLELNYTSAPAAGTYYVGYCQENAAQNGCVSGTSIVDQAVSATGTAVDTNGLTSSSVSLGSTPYLIEIYSASSSTAARRRLSIR